MPQVRNQCIECLRTLAMFSVILLHVSGRYLDTINASTNPVDTAICLGIRQLFFSGGGVSVYAFISGFYGVRFRVSKLLSMEMLAIFWGIAEMAFLASRGELSGWLIRCLLFPTAGGYFWYFSCYMQLLLLSPFVNMGIKYMSKEQLRYAVIALSLYCYVLKFMCKGNDCDVFTLLTLYLIGRYLRSYPLRWLQTRASILVVLLALTNVSITALASYLGLKGIASIMAGNNNPITVLLAISLFYLFLNIKGETRTIRIIALMAPYTLGIYIVHSMILSLYNNEIRETVEAGWHLVILSGLTLFLGSGVLEYMRQKIFVWSRLNQLIEWVGNKLAIY